MTDNKTEADVLALPAKWREQAARHRECGTNGKMLAEIRETCASELERALSAEKAVSREEVERALGKAGAFRRKKTLWLLTTKEATDAVRALMKSRSAPQSANLEAVAKRIYEAMCFERSVPGWSGRGNSIAQDHARATARDVVAMVGAQPDKAGAPNVTRSFAESVLTEYVRIQIDEHADHAGEDARIDAMQRAITKASGSAPDEVAAYLRSEGLLDEGDDDCVPAIRAVVDDRIRLAKWVADLHGAATPPPGAPEVTEEMVYRLAYWMAQKDGHDDPNHLIWEGNPPEPWGEVWSRYEEPARDALTAALKEPHT